MEAIASYLGKRMLSKGVRFLIKRAIPLDDEDFPDATPDPEESADPVAEEVFSSWALFILLSLLCAALWSSYYLQQRRIKAVHETVLSIFYGMIVGLIIRVAPGHYIQDTVKFKSGYFFNILLPPIILNSGYELHQANFFNNIGSILMFAIPGTFISALVLGTILYLWTSLGFDGVKLEFVDALAVGATLSATDPVTILSIFNAYKVDPKLYTIIFGESLLNDAISIVMFETCQQFHGKQLQFSSVFEGIGLFLMTFTISTIIGISVGILVALILKHSHIRRYPQIETCLVLLFAYQSYFFSNGAHMSGIVSLLFCGITLKHYAYFNMSRRTQIATKYVFQLLAQLSENFIFIYLGLSLFTEVALVFKPLLIIVTFVSICIARWCAVFPLSKFLNFLFRAKFEKFSRSNLMSGGISSQAIPEEISHSYQMMIFWAGLRGAVGVALALGILGEAKWTLLATVLVVVVLTVIFFGGTTASMLEILGIKVGCIDEHDSDDEFDIEAPKFSVSNRSGILGSRRGAPMSLSNITSKTNILRNSSSNISLPYVKNSGSSHSLANSNTDLVDDDEFNTSDVDDLFASSVNKGAIDTAQAASAAIAQRSSGVLGSILSAEEHAKWFTRFDEEVLKPVLLDAMMNQNIHDNGSPGVNSNSEHENQG
ncbi:putative endosomal/prevacuolar sodium/hydrogen exchanger [Clavispora lusitaniae]|uniref:Endosomal/prevacuolar sodium/hydrogen exchanger n=1 Tax=Clavispora lusitaniae TaxID=36911 RepID=A0ACD0WGK4_CLALS|nr:monovalent cation:H+ antiporter, CPA1 (nhx1) [Clavispora lusitaniae]QFZ26466.1 putative endosomal/prevacuolar sodium/hydrogen exchanger [Clavispora lusitaniae]QFZ32134.1 putative endosomal/prevacuolar sodium/hydrogen exchanger [Clavispora lusitaniae]QFZ37803.1 putative endosomal/prevacuolar sodium/hydrogen exchanger [Clavispora lusitaniae]QFZ43486.1 putative endosomal/prevacuolar sodium/hydrogen exchanger [Clavispora lusitaniae]